MERRVYECKCDLCSKRLASEKSIGRHMKRVHKYGCIGVSTRHSDVRHEHSHLVETGVLYLPPTGSSERAVSTENGAHRCDLCNKNFATRGNVGNHVMEHLYDRKSTVTWICEECGQSYAAKHSLSNHVRIKHLGRLDFTCEFCGNRYTRKTHLEEHQMSKHENVYFKCDFCNANLKSRCITVHMRWHFGLIQKYKCLTCGKLFSSRSKVGQHDCMFHTEKRKFVCGCGKSFKHKTYYQFHVQAAHSKDPYKCQACKKVFATLLSLATHERIHRDEKWFGCKLCGKTFIQSYSVKVHMRVHTQEKPFHCDKCDAKYTQSYPLTLHKRKHHNQWREVLAVLLSDSSLTS